MLHLVLPVINISEHCSIFVMISTPALIHHHMPQAMLYQIACQTYLQGHQSLFCVRILSRLPLYIQPSVFLGFLFSVTVSQALLGFDDLQNSQEYGPPRLQDALPLEFDLCFSHYQARFVIWGKGLLMSSIQGTFYQHDLSLLLLTFTTWLRWWCQIPCKITTFPLPVLSIKEESCHV